MPQAFTDSLRIQYDDMGGGETAFLCLPGWCDSRGVFKDVLPALSRQARVLALDWRGHGESDVPSGEFTAGDLLSDALAVIDRAGVRQVVPLAVSHAGWVAIELRRRAGRHRVPGIIFLDWIVLDPPAEFLGAVQALQDPQRWHDVRDHLFCMWLGQADDPKVRSHVYDTMGCYGQDMWARAGREIAKAYHRWCSPLKALGSLDSPTPVLHIYSQPRDAGYLDAQLNFAKANPWFSVRRLDAGTHFPTIETPESVAGAVSAFTASEEICSPAAIDLRRP